MSEEFETPPTPPMLSKPMSKPSETSAKPTPEQEKYLSLVRELTDASAMLVIKVATTQCNHKDTCGVYEQARKIAFIIDKLQGIRAESPKISVKGGVKVGRSRKGV
jgi:hypothetical protein